MTIDTELNAELRELFERNPELQILLPETREVGWRYFHVGRSIEQSAKRGFPMFAWSIERDPSGKFCSWVWKPNYEGWTRTKLVRHSKRKSAKARALKMRDTYVRNRTA